MTSKTFNSCVQRELDNAHLNIIEAAFPVLKGGISVIRDCLYITPAQLGELLYDIKRRFVIADPTRDPLKPGQIGKLFGLDVIVNNEIKKMVEIDESFNPSRR